MPYQDAGGGALYRGPQLNLARCPHCGIAKPHLPTLHMVETSVSDFTRGWSIYGCTVCGGVVLAASVGNTGIVTELYPTLQEIDARVPNRPREYLKQAQESLSQPVGSIVVSAAAIDSMLKAHGLTEGDLYSRIDKAAEKRIITPDMAKWAHQARLDANFQRHADESTPLPTSKDARKSLDFALALAQVLFVIPDMVTKGIEDTSQPTGEDSSQPNGEAT